MNNQKIYDQIISRSRNREMPAVVEKHHVVPRCLGGTNAKENIAYLSPREHFICHLLLTKMYDGEARKKMLYAFLMMSRGCRRKNQHERYTPSSKLFHSLKQDAYQALRGRIISDVTRKIISEKAKLRPSSFKGKTHSAESREKQSAAKRGKEQHPNSRKALNEYRATNKARHLHTPEIASKISNSKREKSPLIGNFEIRFSDNSVEYQTNLFEWAKNKNVSLSTVRHILSTGNKAKQGPLRNVTITKI